MGVPSRAARLAHAGRYCELWNAGRKDEWVASWRTIVQGEVTMFDPVGTKPKHGFDVAMSRAFDQFQPVTELHMVTVKANGPEMAWVIDNPSARVTASSPASASRRSAGTNRAIW